MQAHPGTPTSRVTVTLTVCEASEHILGQSRGLSQGRPWGGQSRFGGQGAETTVWVQFILTPIFLGPVEMDQLQWQAHPFPSPTTFLLDLLSSHSTNREIEAWKENGSCARCRSVNSQDSALSSAPQSCLRLSVPDRETEGSS